MAPLPLRRSRGQRSGNCLRSRVTWSSAISVLIRSLTRRAVTIKLFDLAGAEPDRRFSPYCWRTKLALAHKGLTVETIPWRFSDTDAIEMSGQGRGPGPVGRGKSRSGRLGLPGELVHTQPAR